MRYPVRDFATKWYDAQPFGRRTSYGFHEGADLNLKTGGNSDLGEPIFAIADGLVTSVHIHTTSNSFGKHIHIRHEGDWGKVWCHYAHCSQILVAEGTRVKEGQLVALVGRSGAVVSHLHWSIKLQTTGVDGLARSAADLKKWTNPILFVRKWQKPSQSKMLLSGNEALALVKSDLANSIRERDQLAELLAQKESLLEFLIKEVGQLQDQLFQFTENSQTGSADETVTFISEDLTDDQVSSMSNLSVDSELVSTVASSGKNIATKKS